MGAHSLLDRNVVLDARANNTIQVLQGLEFSVVPPDLQAILR